MILKVEYKTDNIVKYTLKDSIDKVDVGTLDDGTTFINVYKENRKKRLEKMAKYTAKDVAKTKTEAHLEPMNSYERRIIHSILSNNKYVYTESVGEEPNRCVVVKPKEV